MPIVNFESLKDKTIARIIIREDYEVFFECLDGSEYVMNHQQDCCESVSIESIVGDINDLIGHPILEASETSNTGDDCCLDSSTWTFYRLSTVKGTVTIRWLGESNGYYSESVDFCQIKPANKSN